ncbi:hypothetical protein MHBO_000045 [Bonamia ostreae]|uniref:Uncharacterized protein n=1 Tax=Bonamia ostreae TaxID=126728 RepID=A0ABV2AE63_9EUKA
MKLTTKQNIVRCLTTKAEEGGVKYNPRAGVSLASIRNWFYSNSIASKENNGFKTLFRKAIDNLTQLNCLEKVTVQRYKVNREKLKAFQNSSTTLGKRTVAKKVASAKKKKVVKRDTKKTKSSSIKKKSRVVKKIIKKKSAAKSPARKRMTVKKVKKTRRATPKKKTVRKKRFKKPEFFNTIYKF